MANNISSSFDIVKKLIGDKWKMLIIFHLFNGRKRTSELMYYIDGITQKVLTQNLRELERLGIIKREVFAEVPPRTDYYLTDIGYSLKPILESLFSWSLDYTNLMEKGNKTEN